MVIKRIFSNAKLKKRFIFTGYVLRLHLFVVFNLFITSCIQFSDNQTTKTSVNVPAIENNSLPPLSYKLDLTHQLQINLGEIIKNPQKYRAIKVFTSEKDQRFISLGSSDQNLGQITIQANGSSKEFKITYFKKNGFVFTKVYNE